MNQPFARRNFVKSLLFAPVISKVDFSNNKTTSNLINESINFILIINLSNQLIQQCYLIKMLIDN